MSQTSQPLAVRASQAAIRTLLWGLAKTGDPVASLTDPMVTANPYPFYDRVRLLGDLAPSRLGNMYATSSHAVVSEVLRSNDFGVENQAEDTASMMEPDGVFHPLGRHSLLALDPPDHTRVRRLVAKPFTPRAVKDIEVRVREIVDETIDARASTGQMDFMDLAATIPLVIICEILGVPSHDLTQFRAWGQALAPTLDVSLDPKHHQAGLDALGPMNAYFERLFEHRRAEPGDAIVDGLLAAHEGGDSLDDAELMTTALLIMLAGFETTVNLLGNGMLALLQNPEQQAMLNEDPTLSPKVVEETLRYDSPVQLTGRLTLRDTEVAGRSLPAGSSVVALLGGANRDPDVFGRPDVFDLERANADAHVSFSSGHHFCLGAPLARMEGAVAFERLAERLTDVRMDGPARRRRTQTLRGLQSLPITFRAR